MARTIRAIALAVLMVGSWTIAQATSAPRAFVDDSSMQTIAVAASDFGSRSVALGIGKAVVVDFPRDIKDVLVADPKTANAIIRTSRRAYIIGVAVGQSNVFFFDSEGRQMAGFDIAVTRDLNGIRAAIRQVLPDADIRVEGIGKDGVILSGTASSQAEAQQAYDIAVRLVSEGTTISVAQGTKVVNAIVVRGRDQVMLKVTVAEVERDLIKQLGINLSGALHYGTAVLNFNNNNPFTALGQSLSGSSITAGFQSVSSTLQAMEQAGVIHTLAEPNLTAISGEKATFYAGGEFPVLSGFSCSAVTSTPGLAATSTCQPSIEFKKFGVVLNFTPIVLSEGRISLQVATDVSEISSENAINIPIPGSVQSVTVPSIRERSANTTVEIPSGGSLAMAGMIQNTTRQNINGLPGRRELPVLGALFKSRDYINQQTELMVLVTPYVVRAVAQKDLSRPDDGFADASDPATVLLGRLNRIYGVGGIPDSPNSYRGKYGFILD